MGKLSLRELHRAFGCGTRLGERLQRLALSQSGASPSLAQARSELQQLAAELAPGPARPDLQTVRDRLGAALRQLRQAGLELGEQSANDSSPAMARARAEFFQITRELQSAHLRLHADGPLRLLRLLDPQLMTANPAQILWFYLQRPRRCWHAASELIYWTPRWVWLLALVCAFLMAHGAVYVVTQNRRNSARFDLFQYNQVQREDEPAASRNEIAAQLANHGLHLLQRKRAADAYLMAQQALAVKSDYVPARCLTAMALVEMERYQEGAAAYRALLHDNPADATALNNLADLLATHPDPALRNGQEAVELATTACALSGRKNPTFLATLAEAQAEAGRLTDAIETARLALGLAREQGHDGLVQSINTRLRWFESGLPVRQPLR